LILSDKSDVSVRLPSRGLRDVTSPNVDEHVHVLVSDGDVQNNPRARHPRYRKKIDVTTVKAATASRTERSNPSWHVFSAGL